MKYKRAKNISKNKLWKAKKIKTLIKNFQKFSKYRRIKAKFKPVDKIYKKKMKKFITIRYKLNKNNYMIYKIKTKMKFKAKIK